MPFYEWVCDKCGHVFDEYKSVAKFKRRIKCPECKEKALRQNYGEPLVMCGPKTLGALADKNADKMGQYEKDKLLGEDMATQIAKANRPLPKGIKGKRIAQTNKIKGEEREIMKKVGRMTQKEQANYIMTGKI